MNLLKSLVTLGGDGGGARGTMAAGGVATLSPLIEPAIRQMMTELAHVTLSMMSPEFQDNAGVLGSMLVMLIISWIAAKAAHHTRPA